MILAACKYPLSRLNSFTEFVHKQEHILSLVKKQGAQIAVLPEYLALELAGIESAPIRQNLLASLLAIQKYWPDWQTLYIRLAQKFDLWICAGTFLVAAGNGQYFNRAGLFGPQGRFVWQDKLQLTQFEKTSKLIIPGEQLKGWDLGSVRTGIAVCYDCEFPMSVRAQREINTQLLLVPSCTDTNAGANRIRVSCQARALENRLAIACATTAGMLPWSPALDTNTGEAAIIVPMDIGFPDDGVLAQTRNNDIWAIAAVDFTLLRNPISAQVAIDEDWPRQHNTASLQTL